MWYTEQERILKRKKKKATSRHKISNFLRQRGREGNSSGDSTNAWEPSRMERMDSLGPCGVESSPGESDTSPGWVPLRLEGNCLAPCPWPGSHPGINNSAESWLQAHCPSQLKGPHRKQFSLEQAGQSVSFDPSQGRQHRKCNQQSKAEVIGFGLTLHFETNCQRA